MNKFLQYSHPQRINLNKHKIHQIAYINRVNLPSQYYRKFRLIVILALQNKYINGRLLFT